MADNNKYSSFGVASSMEKDDGDDNIDQSGSEVEEEHFHSYCSVSADVSESESSFCSPSSVTTGTSSPRRPRPPPPLLPDRVRNFAYACDLPATTTRRPTVMFPVVGDRHVLILAEKPKRSELTEVELIKERFSKLLLGEDVSGGGNGVCSALAMSNAVTNLAATVFGKLWKVEPLPPPKKSMWVREMEWLLCVCDFIVELVPSVQELPGGRKFEVMVPQARPDLSLNLPVLKKLDAMLISILDGFCDCEFYYVDRGIIVADEEYIEARVCLPSQERPSIRLEEKWWLPFPKVPKNGLSQEMRKHLQQSWKCTNHIYKATSAINNTVVSEMEVPNVYLDSLPKSGKACLGETLYHYVTANELPTENLLVFLDLSSEHSTLEIANKLEAALHFWRQKFSKKDLNEKRTAWGLPWDGSLKGFVDIEKCKISVQRADTLLRNLKLRFPGLPQTALDTTKIQHNKDIGQAILESYSRVIKTLAFSLMARIEDLLCVDNATKQRAVAESTSTVSHTGPTGAFNLHKHVPPNVVSNQLNSCAAFLKKSKFCPAAQLFRKMKWIHGSPDAKFERLTF